MSRQQEIVATVQKLFNELSWNVGKNDRHFSLNAERYNFDYLKYAAKIQTNPEGIVAVRIDKTRQTLNKLIGSCLVYTFSSRSCAVTGITRMPQVFSIDDALANMKTMVKRYTQEMNTYKAVPAPKNKWCA